MTLLPILTFTELRLVPLELMQRVWHASRKSLTFHAPGSVSLLGLAYAQIVDTTFRHEYPSVLNRFF